MNTETIRRDQRWNGNDPMSQTEARQLAHELCARTGLTHIATAVPLGSWGGHERGWDVIGPDGVLITGSEKRT